MRTADKPLVPYRLGLSRGGWADTPAACAAPAGGGSPPAAGGDEATVDCGGGGGGGEPAIVGVATPASAGSLPVRELDFAAQLQNGAIFCRVWVGAEGLVSLSMITTSQVARVLQGTYEELCCQGFRFV